MDQRTDKAKKPDWLRIYFVPLILVLVASHHFYTHYQWNRSSWGSGAGFGMFATVDNHSSRFFRCHVQTEQGMFAADIAGQFKYDHLRTRVIPSSDNVERLANRLLDVQWVLVSGDATNEKGKAISPNGACFLAAIDSHAAKNFAIDEPVSRIERLKLSLHGIRFDHKTRSIRSFLMQERTAVDRSNLPPGILDLGS